MLLAVSVLSRAALALLTTCAPFIGVQSMSGLVRIESQWNQYAIADVDAKKAYCVPWGSNYPCSYKDATAIASALLSKHHSISAGYAQINTVNWPKYGLNVYNVFDSCVNLSDGADILSKDYAVAILHFQPGDPALEQSFSLYNSGRFYAAMDYAHDVMAAARDTLARPPTPGVRSLNGPPAPLSAPTPFHAYQAFQKVSATTREPKIYTLFLAPRQATPPP